MTFLRENIKLIGKIAGIICALGALILSYITFFSSKKEVIVPAHIQNTKVEIKGNGDNVNRDKVINNTIVNVEIPKKELKQKQVVEEKPVVKTEPVINNNNNGIVNLGVNNGTQTVNNYNEKPSRKITIEDVNNIRNHIPLDYKITFVYVNSTEESINYANEVFSAIKGIGYNIIEVNSTGMYADGKPYKKDERIDFTINHSDKKAQIVIKEQK